MQFSKAALLFFAAAPLAVQAAGDTIPFVTAFYGDFQSHLNDYLSLIAAGSVSVPPVLFQLYTEVSTYTDDSYTTLIGSDFPIDQLSAFVTALPWYSTRLSSEIAEALADETGAAPTASGESTSSSVATTAASSSVSSAISSALSSAASSASAESSSSSASAVPSASEATSSSGAAGIVGAANPLLLVPLVALSAGALLL